MVSYFKIEEYVTLCRRAEKKETPLEQIEALTNAKKIMCVDLMEEFTARGVSNNWVLWWWDAVVAVYFEFIHSPLTENDLYKHVDFANFIEWVDSLDKSQTRYGNIEKDSNLLPELEKRHPKMLEFTYRDHPLSENETKPTVTTLDMVFYILLQVWEESIWKLSRQATVDGKVKKPQDALPAKEYLKGNFIQYYVRPLPTARKRYEPNAFKEAVQKVMRGPWYDTYCGPAPEEGDDFYHDYENDDNYKEVDISQEKVPTIVFHEYDSRKATELSELHLQLEEYLESAREILEERTGRKERYEALGRLYDDISEENGGYIDDPTIIRLSEVELFELGVNMGLLAPLKKSKKTKVLKTFLEKVKALTERGDSVTYIGGETDIVEGWSWEPVDGIYPALVIMALLREKIREEMRILHRHQSDEEIPRHKFPEYGHFDEWDLKYVEELRYVIDDDLEQPLYPDWVTGRAEVGQVKETLPHFSLDVAKEILLDVLKGLKDVEWKNNRVKDKSLIFDDVTEDEWLYCFKGHTQGRKDATRKITWKTKYACKSFVVQFLNSDYEMAEKIFNIVVKGEVVDIKRLSNTRIDRNPEICDESTGKIAEIIRNAMKKYDEVKSMSSSVK